MTSIPTEQLDRVLVGAVAALVFTPADDDGEAIPLPVAASATLTITDGAGEILTDPPLTVTLPPQPEGGEDAPDLEMSCEVPAATVPLLDSYTLTWELTAEAVVTSWDTALEIVGGFHCTVAAFRDLRGEFATVAAEDVRDARTLAEMRFEDECRVAFVPRGARETLKGDGTDVLLLEHVELRRVYSLAVDGAELLVALDLSGRHAGIIVNPDGVFATGAVIEIHYSHGYDRADRPVRGAIMTLMKDYIVPDSKLPPRAVLQLSDYGNFRLAQPDENHPFGDMPDVESVYELYNRRRPAVG